MSPDSSEPVAGTPQPAAQEGDKWGFWVSLGLSAVVLMWFYAGQADYGADRSASAFRWIFGAWNGETDYEHGLLFPFVIAGLITYRFKDLKNAAGKGCNWGLLVVFFGVLFYVAGFRTLQPRITLGALPFLLWGAALF